MKLFNKILLTAAIGMSLMAVTGCGSINPKDIEGAYKNDERTYYLYHSGAIETGNKERIEKFKVYTTTPKSNYKGKQYYDSTPKILIDNYGNVCDQELLGGKKIIGKIFILNEFCSFISKSYFSCNFFIILDDIKKREFKTF